MDIDKQPWHVQVQIRELQALFHDYRSGKLNPRTKQERNLRTKQERNILRLIETIALAVLVSEN